MKTITELKELTNQIDKIMNEFEKILPDDLHDISSTKQSSIETENGGNECTAKSQ